jgi:NAD+ synthase
MMEYYHADRLDCAVAGTPNRLEYDQGFSSSMAWGKARPETGTHLHKARFPARECLGIGESSVGHKRRTRIR